MFYVCFLIKIFCSCIFCLLIKVLLFQQTSARQCVLRTKESYEDDQKCLESTGFPAHGVKSQCFIESAYFNRADALAADIHHDVLEGLVPFMLKPILQV